MRAFASPTARCGSVRSRVAGAALAVILLAAGCGGPATGQGSTAAPIGIGMVVGLSGYLAPFDAPFVEGAELAVEQINAAGGVDGRQIELHVVDGASSPATGVSVATELLNQHELSAFVNGASSATSEALIPLLRREQVPAFSSGQIPSDPEWTFLSQSAYQTNLDVQLGFAAERLGAKSVSFLYSQTPYGQLGAGHLPVVADRLGLQVLQSTAVDATTTDLSPIMASVHSERPDAVVDFLTGATHIVAAKAASTVGLGVPIVMGVDATDPVRTATVSYPETYFTAAPVQVYPNIGDPGLKEAAGKFVEVYQRGGGDPSLIGTAGYGWDAVQMVAAAADAAGAADGASVRAALEGMTHQGVNALYRMTPTDHSGQLDGRNPLSIARVTAGGAEVVYTVS